MDLKKDVKEIIKWAQESEENKKKAIHMTEAMVTFLKEESNDLSDTDLDDIVGGMSTSSQYCTAIEC